MKTIAVIMQKGGSGKSTTVVHLGAFARSQGLSAALIDIDPQGNAYNWNLDRAVDDERSPQLPCELAEASSLKPLLKSAKQGGVDLVIIDTAPHSNSEAAIACQMADLVVIPCRPSRFDLEAFGSTVAIAKAARKPVVGFINAAPRGHVLANEARAVMAEHGIPVLETIIHQRAALSHAVIDGRAVHEFEPNGKAAAEIEALYRDITRLLDDTHTQQRHASRQARS